MHPVAKLLESELSGVGWAIARKEKGHEWWIEEWWELHSLWSPQEAKVFIWFLVDPGIYSGMRLRSEDVWEVVASPRPPDDRERERQDEVELRLGRHWPKRYPDFLGKLTQFRPKKADQVSHSERP